MDQTHRYVEGTVISAYANESIFRWDEFVGSSVRHAEHGEGIISSVKSRGSYTPLIVVSFASSTRDWTPKSFCSGRTTVLVEIHKANAIEDAWKEAEENRRQAKERADVVAERIAQLKQEAHHEAQLWASLSPEERAREARVGLLQRHKTRLENLGLTFQGVRSATRKPRKTHCYTCFVDLDNSIDVECITCGWILCECGACGCGYEAAIV